MSASDTSKNSFECSKRSRSPFFYLSLGFFRDALWRLVLVCLITCPLCLVNAFVNVPAAGAATWPLDAPRGSVSLEFHESYSAHSKSYVHSGIDISAEAGSVVSAPCRGVITFCGSVPSGDSAVDGGGTGETMRAVSMTISSGQTVTLMPFESFAVKRGDKVVEGQELGILAASGDRSSSSAHLHMGLKRNGEYYDPLTLFGMSCSAGGAAALDNDAAVILPSESSDAGLEAGADASALAQGAGQEETATETSSATAAPDGQAVPDEESTASEGTRERFGSISSGDAVISKTDEDAESGIFDDLQSAVSGIATACSQQALGIVENLEQFAFESGIPFLALVTFLVALVIASAALCVGLAVRVVRRCGFTLGDSANSLLCSADGGDSMHKLFPAPGTSFITRGRLAQRR